MCAVVTVGAVVGPTCGACAARARRWPTAYRRVPKRCGPKSWGLFSTKIINRAIFACFAPRKQVRVCKFHSFGGVFCFLLYTRAQKRASPTPSLGEWHRKWANTGASGRGWLARGREAAENPPHRARPRGDASLSATQRRTMLGAPLHPPPPLPAMGGARLSSLTAFFAHYP